MKILVEEVVEMKNIITFLISCLVLKNSSKVIATPTPITTGIIHGEPILPRILSGISSCVFVLSIVLTLLVLIDLIKLKKAGKKLSKLKIVLAVIMYIIWISIEILMNWRVPVV